MTKQEIENIIENYKQATLAMYEVSQKEEQIKLEKMATRAALVLAREALSEISF